MEYFNLLPQEITLDIISRLPTESVLECKLVSTNWRSIIRHPSFSKMHLDHLNHPEAASGKMGFLALTSIDERIDYNLQYFEYDENHKSIERIRRVNFNLPFRLYTSFHGSCNGLICYYFIEKTCIFNPITREYILLPELKGVGACGFGYVSSTNEYKAVRTTFVNETEFMEVHVYTLGSGNGWRNIGKFNFGTREPWGEGLHLNGALYWLDFHLEMIFPFDFAEEKFAKHISLPKNDFGGYLGVLDGCLSFACSRHVNEAECWDVWLLKNKDDNNGMKEREGHQSLGWSEGFEVFGCEEFRVSDNEIFAVTKSYDVLTSEDNQINVHNPEASTWKRIVDFKEHFSVMFPHKNTFVSLKELGEECTKIMESVEIEETESHAQPFNQL